MKNLFYISGVNKFAKKCLEEPTGPHWNPSKSCALQIFAKILTQYGAKSFWRSTTSCHIGGTSWDLSMAFHQNFVRYSSSVWQIQEKN